MAVGVNRGGHQFGAVGDQAGEQLCVGGPETFTLSEGESRAPGPCLTRRSCRGTSDLLGTSHVYRQPSTLTYPASGTCHDQGWDAWSSGGTK